MKKKEVGLHFFFFFEIATTSTTKNNKKHSYKVPYPTVAEPFHHHTKQNSPLSHDRRCHLPETNLVWDSLSWRRFLSKKFRIPRGSSCKVFCRPKGTAAVVPSGGGNISAVTISNSFVYDALAAQGGLLSGSQHKFYLYLKAPVLSCHQGNDNSSTYICFQCN